jgi:hypothetical protein
MPQGLLEQILENSLIFRKTVAIRERQHRNLFIALGGDRTRNSVAYLLALIFEGLP